MDKKLKAISKVSVALALLGAAAPVAGTAPTALAAKKSTKKKAKKAKKKAVKKTYAKKYTPKAKSVTVKASSKLSAKSVITNASKLPAKTKYAFSPKPSLKKAGTYIVSVIVTYPDKSKDKVKNVKIKVTAKKAAYNPAKAAYEKYKKQAAELGSLADAQNDLSQKKAALDNANQAYTDAVASYNNKVAVAKASYDEAASAYEAAGYDFIMSKATPNFYQDSKNEMATVSELTGYVSGLDASVKSFLSTSNLKKDVTLIKELNDLRASDNNFSNHNALGVDYDLMIYASIAGFISDSTKNHTYFRNAPTEVYASRAENLAWGYSDPLTGWYTEEKAIYDAHGSGVTGHYTNCMGDYEYVGLVLDQSTGTSAADFGREKILTSESGMQVSVEEFEAALNSYVASYESTMNTAKAAYEQTKADKSEVNAAQENATSSKKTYDAADAKVKKVKTVNQQLAKAYTAYQKSLKAAHKKK
ncbi:Rib/alpha-like domain-containing protein [Lactobacillus delbrueckii]|uniref:Rib/alpha-like domain-containing protein n=1 Tax=Lactobacillus delbrueckii TaxID=1584 RepID=A0AAW5YYJ2_9LACO|nr:Rib/alpha-like domain-containing protein [Lactobacillus delbrueckii]MDA3768630.1 Rib/alpha-like domain-containing protein [Lactobacillus delbrueckii]